MTARAFLAIFDDQRLTALSRRLTRWPAIIPNSGAEAGLRKAATRRGKSAGVVLPVAVERGDEAAPRGQHAGAQSAALPAACPMGQDAKIVLDRARLREARGRRVGAAIVDVENFIARTVRQRGPDFPDQRQYIVGFVLYRDDDREHDRPNVVESGLRRWRRRYGRSFGHAS